MSTATKKAEQAEAVERLRELVHPGDTIYTVLRHVSASGMTRHVDAYVIRDGQPVYLSGYAAKAAGYTRTPQGAVKITGAGMDMGFALVYAMARVVFADGFTCTGVDHWGDGIKPCPSNDHSNGDRDYTPHPHSDPGYALRQEWL